MAKNPRRSRKFKTVVEPFLGYGIYQHVKVLISPNQMQKIFTFSKPCIVIHIREGDELDAHFFSLIYSN